MAIEIHNSEELQNQFFTLLNDDNWEGIREYLTDQHAPDIASLIESSPNKYRERIWALVLPEEQGEVVNYLSESVRIDLLNAMDTQQLVAATEHLEADDLADIIQDIPERAEEIILSLDTQRRKHLEAVLSYSEEVAGGLMDLEVITLRPGITIDVVMRYLRMLGELPHSTDALFVVDKEDQLLGFVPLGDLLVHHWDTNIDTITQPADFAILADTPTYQVASLFDKHDLITAPVVDYNHKLLGRITIDDAVDVIKQEAEHSFMSMAGLKEEEDTFAPVIRTTKRRTLWLGVNLMTAFIAASVIGLFDATIDQIVALAVLMPIVASMGGIAGSQTLTIVIRGIALGQVNKQNARALVIKELSVGLFNGLIWSVVIALAAYAWFHDPAIAVIIGIAIMINLIVAATAGATIPLLLDKMKIDPALAGGIALTTLTDSIGFMAFLGLATLYLIN